MTTRTEREGSGAARRNDRARAPGSKAELQLVLGELEALRRAALVDPLTGLWNRRGLDDDLPQRLAVANRGARPVTLVVGDLDGLKAINDGQGHAAGDQALRDLVAALDAALRAGDSAYRIGGDEFVLLLPDTTAVDAAAVLARVDANAPAVSWGAATFPGDGVTGAALMELADQRMLEGRRANRAAVARGAAAESRSRSRRSPRATTATALIVVGMLSGVGVGFAAERVIDRPAPAATSVEAPAARVVPELPERGQPISEEAVEAVEAPSTTSVAASSHDQPTATPTIPADLGGIVDGTSVELPTVTISLAGIDVVLPLPALAVETGEVDVVDGSGPPVSHDGSDRTPPKRAGGAKNQR